MKEEEEKEEAAKVARNARKKGEESAMNGRVIVDVKSGVMP